MTAREHAYAYHAPTPSACPPDQWTRAEVRGADELRPVSRSLADAMKGLGYPRKDVFAIELTLAEAVVNAIRHGHAGDRSRAVVVTYRVGPTETFVEVTDEGPGFDPYAVPNPLEEAGVQRPSGRGLFLMRVYLTWIRYNVRGNRVTLCKRRSDLDRHTPEGDRHV